MLVFRVGAKQRIVFTVTQVWPSCDVVGTFAVRTHRGTNRIPFRGELNGQPLEAGTYVIKGRTQRGIVLRFVVLVVESGTPTPAQVAAARASNVCVSSAAATSGLGFEPGSGSAMLASSITGNPSDVARDQKTQGVASASAEEEGSPVPGVVSPAHLAKNARNPLVIAALVAAILLLGLAAAPSEAFSEPRLNDLLVRHRSDVAFAGGGVLVAAVIALLFG